MQGSGIREPGLPPPGGDAPTIPPASTALIDGMFRQALALTREAQHYIAGSARQDRTGLDPAIRLLMAAEITRLTRRLTLAMVWLRLLRSVHGGSVPFAELCRRFPPLAEHRLCLDDAVERQLGLPVRLRSLLDRSLALYRRIARLDRMVRRHVAGDQRPAERGEW